MSNQTERAEAGTRLRMSHEDRTNYTGLVRHPLARRWMLQRLIEARDKAATADSMAGVDRWSMEAERVSIELNRSGYKVGGGE